ncbi:DUF4440 domain-containing protein [Sphingomonas sp.]|uniref:DUF4440 domain-containing protein n=1 Tax=Sphingomonas sp. TaxID=28214 RepID=UPI003AFFA965
MIRSALVTMALAIAAVPAGAAQPRPADVTAVTALIDAVGAARRGFDQAALARLTAPDYVEVSPIGEVDPREKMLGFYAADKKTPVPVITTDERTVSIAGTTAIVTERQSIGERAIRVLYVARYAAAKWQLVSAQFTPIRTPRPS